MIWALEESNDDDLRRLGICGTPLDKIESQLEDYIKCEE